jgi:hypothetical protein
MTDINRQCAPFEPQNCGEAKPTTVALAVAATSSNVALVLPVTPALNPPNQVSVYNAGTTVVFVAFGPNAAAAVAVAPVPGTPGDYPVLPGAQRTISVPQATKYAACIGTVGGNVYFTPGKGV